MTSAVLARNRVSEGGDASAGPRRGVAWIAALAAPLVVGMPLVAAARLIVPGRGVELSGVVLVLLLATAAATDLRRGKIYNWATYPAVLWALAINAVATLAAVRGGGSARLVDWLGAVGLADSLLGFAACFVPMLLIFRHGGGGAGDVKLAGAMGALLGLERGVLALLCAYVAAGVGVLALALWTIGPVTMAAELLRRVGARLFPAHVLPPAADRRDFLRRRIRLGPYYAVGGLLALLGVVAG